MSESTPRSRVGLGGRSAVVLLMSTLFLAGPTPGDVGGCGGDQSDVPLPTDSQGEYDFFDQGICQAMCYRLRACNMLCDVIALPAGARCDNFSREAYEQCVRGDVRTDRLQTNRCPHSCGNYMSQFTGASQRDLTVCNHAVDSLSCDDILNVVVTPPNECLAVCR